jgi:His-Xaa-Ser system protein HxsD
MKIDKRIYNDTCVSKAVYSVSDLMTIQRTYISENEEFLKVICKPELLSEYEKRLTDALNDYHLRGIIENETHDIRTILYAKAFEDDEELDLPKDEYL